MLKIVTQPKVNKSYWDLHGRIYAERGGDDYPTLRLTISKSKYIPGAEYHILCTLHPFRDTGDRDSLRLKADNKILPLSVHFIQKMSEPAEDDNESDVNCNSNLFELMEWQKSMNNDNLFYRFEMKNCRIVLVDCNGSNNNNAGGNKNCKSLGDRKAQIIDMNLEFLDENAGNEFKVYTEFCLGFTVFEKLSNTEHFTQIKPTIYSKPLPLNSSLQLQRIIPYHGNVDGGDEVALLFESLKHYDKAVVNVYTDIFDFKQRELITSIEILKRSAQRQRNILWNKNTILFDLPPLPEYLRTVDFPAVRIVVSIPSTGETSNDAKFYYDKKQSNEDNISTLMQNTVSTSKQNSTGDIITICDSTNQTEEVIVRSATPEWIVIHENISNDFWQSCGDNFKGRVHTVLQFPECSTSFRVTVDNGFSMCLPINVILLSEAIEEEFNKVNRSQTKLLTAVTARRRYNIKPRISIPDALETAMDFFHAYRDHMIAEEAIVHLYPQPGAKTDYIGYYTLSYKKSFRPMIDAKCSIVEQDLVQNTPLHAAIALNHRRAIDQFIDIFANYANYSKDFQDDLKKVFDVYDKDGHTVMQAAICKKMDDLVSAMEAYCKNNSIDPKK